MTDRMDCIAFVGERNFPKKLGSAVPRKDGNGWQVYLETVPIGWNGEMTIQPPRPKPDTVREPW
jgi:hypothetical protein